MKLFRTQTTSVLLLIAMAISGCGGSNGGGSKPANPYAGDYQANVGLGASHDGALALTAAEDGSATGTLTVTSTARASRQAYDFQVGEFDIEGTVDSDGSFELTGNIPGSGPFEVTGDLPIDANGEGTLVVSAGGETYEGTISVSIGGGTGDITFSNGSGTNANLGGLSGLDLVVSNVNDDVTYVAYTSPGTENQRALVGAVSRNVEIGESVSMGDMTDFTSLQYSEGITGNRVWTATSGTVKLLARSATGIKVQYTNVRMEPADEAGNTATGQFTLNGTVEK